MRYLTLDPADPSCPWVCSVQYMRIHPLTEEGKTTSTAKLASLRAADDIRRETSQAKNELESYILKVKQGKLGIGCFCGNASKNQTYLLLSTAVLS